MSFACKICSKEFETAKQRDGHLGAHSVGIHLPRNFTREDTNAKVKNRIQKVNENGMFSCKFCLKEFDNFFKRNGHTSKCNLHPKFEEIKLKVSKVWKGRKHSKETKEKLSKITNVSVKNGTWHNSFSRSRTHDYKGIKLYGMWEVKYAIYLDSQNTKWTRPKESFPYEFEGKVKRYTPDFYLIDSNTYVEIKGYQTPKDEAKWKYFPHKLVVIKGEQLVEMGILEEREIKRILPKSI